MENVKQFVAIHALKYMSIFQKERVALELDNETLEDSNKLLIFEDSDGLGSGDLEIGYSVYEPDEESVEIAEKNVQLFEIHTYLNMPLWERIKTQENQIAIEHGKKVVTIYYDTRA